MPEVTTGRGFVTFDRTMETLKARKIAEVRRIARSQHGVITRAQAIGAGFSVSAVARAVERREWRRLHPGMFLVDPAADPLRSRMMAAVLRAPGRTWISHRSAAALWGMIDVPTPLRPDVTTTANLRGGGATIHLTALVAEDAAVRDGIPVTSPERTLVDLGALLSRADLEAAVVSALRSRVADSSRLHERARRLARPGRRGPAPIAAVLDGWGVGAPPESVLESRMLRLLRAAGLPEPVRQWEVRAGARVAARLDFAYPELMIGIEADGWRWHSDAGAWRRDLARRNRLTNEGWTMLHFTWHDVTRRPREVAETIRAEISRRNVPETGTKRRELPT